MSLCLRCGLCCDGALFGTASVTAEEAARLEGRVALTPDRRNLVQPCRALSGCACTVYEDRPATCRAFKCEVLAALEHGEVTEAEALAEVERALSLRRVIAKSLGMSDERAALREARRRLQADELPDDVRDTVTELNRFALAIQLVRPRR
ncbi:MAG: YkgJ family cysteine cluster protein [Myxococcales bacterium]|nr:YkgJ family cysteine cluster protein [Myxococcales bacterium]